MQVAQVDFKSHTASKDFADSLINTGFAVIKNHPIDYSLVKEVFSEWASFFASDYKMNYLYNNDTQDGLFPISVSETAVGYDIKDIKEFYHYYPWGQYPKELTDKTKELQLQMTNVAATLLKWAEDNLPSSIRDKLTEPLSSMIKDSEQILMRILHYPPLKGDEAHGAIRANAHTDINLLTVLVAASESGLEVQNKNGNWIEVPVDPGMLSINISDMLQEATDGFYKSTVHRVVNPTDENRLKSRYSIPLFLHARPDVVLSSRYTAGSFLQERLKQIGTKK
jgi:isopenicillin N synthase-like dioxygenase